MQKGKLILPGQDAEANMYGYLMDTMAAHGRQQYEISNFCKPGYESRHNITYWANEEYYGFGAGAHGFLGDTRYSNAAFTEEIHDALRSRRITYISNERFRFK